VIGLCDYFPSGVDDSRSGICPRGLGLIEFGILPHDLRAVPEISGLRAKAPQSLIHLFWGIPMQGLRDALPLIRIFPSFICDKRSGLGPRSTMGTFQKKAGRFFFTNDLCFIFAK
jgi:hypothetical protein